MSNAYHKRPLSIAVSMVLAAAAAAASAVAAEGAGPPAPNAGPQDAAQPDSGATKALDELQEITITGVRESQIRAIELKRLAPSIQDSISAESIGQLPDVTITDALQRITGVQIDRDAGVGTTVNVRGLPQVGTMLNGEVFITPDQIDSQKPDFTTLPATLFNQVDVIKSATAGQTVSGISGSLNLHTFRPWDLPSGFTYSYSANGERGDRTHKTGPEANGLVSFNGDGRWGLLVAADFSDTTRENSTEGLDQYGVVLNGENATSAATYTGFLGAWNGAPIPSQIHQNPDGSVDVNGDGKSNGVFMGSQDISLYDTSTQRKRQSLNTSFQADLDHGFKLTSDYFYGHQDEYNRTVGIQFNSTNFNGATYVPLRSRDTGATALGSYNTPSDADHTAFLGSQIYSTQVYEKWPGDVESYTSVVRKRSTAQNFNLQLDFDDGGPFKGSVRGIREVARQDWIESDINISDSDGCLWADPNSALPCGTFVYPAQLGGDRVFNANGIPQNTVPITADFSGRNLVIGLPPSLAATFANRDAWTMKTLESSDDYNRNTSITALRFDGNYQFNDRFKLEFGVRHSQRDAHNDGFTLVTPVYGGIGATNPNGTSNATGCLVRYAGSDVILSGNATYNPDGSLATPNTWCTAGNSEGYFRAGPISSQPLSKTPPSLANNFQQYTNLLGSGITFWGINPHALDDPLAYWKSLYPNTTTQAAPGITWAVSLKETSTYLQSDFNGPLGDMNYAGNVGVRVIRTGLDITQDRTGLPGQYGTEPGDAGGQTTLRSYTDVLPAANFALNITDKLTMRLSVSKNMQPLDLSQWGGGLQLNYSLLEQKSGPIYQVSTGSSTGNPALNPWRSTNYGASFEYYVNRTTMVGLELFRIDVQSFIKSGGVTRCDLPDEDGVVRHHCITITEPLQGTGNSIQGAEFDYRQGFTFLPGLLANTGVEINATYAPSNSGETDLAGHRIPFQDNSTESANVIVWYQDKRFQARLAYNYRSERAVEESVGGIAGLEEYEAPQKYLDASVSYKFSKYAQVFLDASNLTNEYQRYYLVWKDQPAHSNFSERMFMLGLRGQW